MTTNTVRPCRSLKPSDCPYHGAMIRMDDALASGDFNAYTAARAAFDVAADAKKHAVFNLNLPEAPAGATYEYAGASMTNEVGAILYQIRAKRNIPSVGVKKGDLGGWVDPTRLSNRKRISGNAWVGGNAQLYGNASIAGAALINENAEVFGDAWISGQATISGNAEVFGKAMISDYAQVDGDAEVSGNAIVSGYRKISGNDTVRW